MKRKKALILTYYWPPSGGPGVQRWLKFSKYLRDFGWEPVVYTAENPEAPAVDRSLEKDIPENLTVIRRKIREPYSLYKLLTRQEKGMKVSTALLNETRKPGKTELFARWVRGNFFIPDARKFWIRPSVRYLAKWIAENPVDVVISTGPPHSMHMIGRGLQKRTGLPWIADFRDPWTTAYYYHAFLVSRRAEKKHRQMEAEVVTGADRVIAVSTTWKQEFEHRYARPVDLLTNGFDEEDFAVSTPAPDPYFSLSQIGTMMPDRNLPALWQALSGLINSDADFAMDFRLMLIGTVDASVKEALEAYGLTDHVIHTGYLPHNEVITRLKSSHVLLDVLKQTPNTKGILSGKIFEYLAAKRPVLLIGSTGSDAAELIRETGAGYSVNFDDAEGIQKIISRLYASYKNNTLKCESRSVNEYSRKNITQKLSRMLDEVLNP
ncbi:MAG: glycosyltransferase family 4 protein [Balneolales bacterium]